MSPVHISAVEIGSNQFASWQEANQACLVLEFACLRDKLREAAAVDAREHSSGADTNRRVPIDDMLQELQEAREAIEPASAIDTLTRVFGLSSFERELLLLCAGIEMDSALAQLCSSALGGDTRTSITFALGLATLVDPHWSALAPTAALRRFHLIVMEAGHGLTAAPLRIDERILHYLAGVNLLDERLETLLHPKGRPDWIAGEHTMLAEEILQAREIFDPHSPVLHLCGDDPRGQEDIAALIAHTGGRQLFVLSAEDIPTSTGSTFSESGSSDVARFVALWTREADLLPGVLLVQFGVGGLNSSARQIIERLPAPLILASRDSIRLTRSSVRYAVNKPVPVSQRQLWEQTLGPRAKSLNGELDELAEQFHLSAESIATASQSACSRDGDLKTDQLWNICRSISRPRLEDLAERIVPTAGWSDLILPDSQKQTLRQLAAQSRHRMKVYETWGFSERGGRGLGISALFAGASGTGKTLAAEVLAHELRLDLYRIDLSAVVSKYIGESEKNLKQVFDAAEEGGVLLLFDEADALFGRRSEVKDSHDRYANIEVSYLLQRMETFQGLAVLTTNLKSSLDRAFQRRLRFTVEFPFPGRTEREAIWQSVFPARTPTHGLDPTLLGQLNMTGGNIHNIALNAAFLAAESGGPVGMDHLLQATRQEAMKIERALSEAEIRGWV